MRCFLFVGIFLSAFCHPGFAVESQPREELLLLDLREYWHMPRMGVSIHNILDHAQWLQMAVVPDDQWGQVIRLDHDVASFKPAKVGFWLRPCKKDFSNQQVLNLYFRREGGSSGTQVLTVRLVDEDFRSASYIISGLEETWKRFSIPLKNFTEIRNWSSIREIVIVMDDIHARPKEGTIYLARISLS